MDHLFTDATMGALWACFVIATAASTVSITITQTEIFAPVRALADKGGHMISYLFQCFYCMSHWCILAGIIAYQPRIIHGDYLVIDLIVSLFFTVTLCVFMSGFVFKAFLVAMSSKLAQMEMKEKVAQK